MFKNWDRKYLTERGSVLLYTMLWGFFCSFGLNSKCIIQFIEYINFSDVRLCLFGTIFILKNAYTCHAWSF